MLTAQSAMATFEAESRTTVATADLPIQLHPQAVQSRSFVPDEVRVTRQSSRHVVFECRLGIIGYCIHIFE